MQQTSNDNSLDPQKNGKDHEMTVDLFSYMIVVCTRNLSPKGCFKETVTSFFKYALTQNSDAIFLLLNGGNLLCPVGW